VAQDLRAPHGHEDLRAPQSIRTSGGWASSEELYIYLSLSHTHTHTHLSLSLALSHSLTFSLCLSLCIYIYSCPLSLSRSLARSLSPSLSLSLSVYICPQTLRCSEDLRRLGINYDEPQAARLIFRRFPLCSSFVGSDAFRTMKE
jgi:hypothetical protein